MFISDGIRSLAFAYAIYVVLLLPHIRDIFNYAMTKGRRSPPYGWKLQIPSLIVGLSLIVFHTMIYLKKIAANIATDMVMTITLVSIVIAWIYYVLTEKPKNGMKPPGTGS